MGFVSKIVIYHFAKRYDFFHFICRYPTLEHLSNCMITVLKLRTNHAEKRLTNFCANLRFLQCKPKCTSLPLRTPHIDRLFVGFDDVFHDGQSQTRTARFT